MVEQGKGLISSLLWGCECLAKAYWVLITQEGVFWGGANLIFITPLIQLWESSQAEPGCAVRRGGRALIPLLPLHQSLPSG